VAHSPTFIFSTCQVGAETVFKKEIARTFPGMRSAFARPGFVTFKTETQPPEDFTTRSVFARTAAISLGKIEPDQPDTLATDVWKIASEHHLFVNHVHVFGRDLLPTGEHDGEPHIPSELIDLHRKIVAQSPTAKFLRAGAEKISQPAQPGETVLDVVRVEPNLFFVGTHVVTETSPIHARYSGGILPITLPDDAVSRAYLKFNEGHIWSGITFRSGDRCLDIGVSPGGCSQYLLQQGVSVFGVDPGAVHPTVLDHPQFTHIRSRIRDTKRSLFRDVQWITADMNVAPNYTLEVLEEVIAKTEGSVRGLLFTLKLLRWELADKLPEWLNRIRTWGFRNVRMKQLIFNRQEIMAAVM
jgi:23S rRNA (cytidine2498-2'-O)-methyltransferase